VKTDMSEEPKKQENASSTRSKDKDTVYVGNKPSMRYVMAALFQLHQGTNKLTFKARGRAISKAVDVVEITRRRFMKDSLSVKDITIGTEVIGTEGDTRNVSTIEITVEKI